MTRSVRTITRRDNLLDFLTPNPVVDLSTEVLNQIQWSMGQNFDTVAPALTVVAPVSDYFDPGLTLEQRFALTSVPHPNHLRFTFNPATFGLDGSKTFWMKRTVRINGVDTNEPGLYMMSPRLSSERPTHVISGTAPSGATVANSLQLELPSAMTSVSISVTGGSDLAIAYDRRDREQIVPNGKTDYIYAGTVTTLFIRGVGGSSDFQIVVSRAYSL